jgi:outer membrane protein assembly factor BamB
MKNLVYAFKKILNNKPGTIGENWKYDIGSALNSKPVVSDIDGDGEYEIITGTNDGKVVALDSKGKLKWSYAIQETVDDLELMFLDTESVNSVTNAPHAEDLFGDGKTNILFGTELGYVYMLSFDGQLIWKFKSGAAIRGRVIANEFTDGQKDIIFGSSDKYVYCLNNNGDLRWKFNCGSEVEGTPHVIDNKIIVGTNSGEIFCFAENGSLVWKFQTKGKIVAQAVGHNLGTPTKKILIGSTDGILYCLDVSGHIYWEYKTDGAIYDKIAIEDVNSDGKPEILFGSCDNKVYCLNLEGKKLWSFETDFWVVSTPLIFDLDKDGKFEIIVGSYDHNLYVLDGNGSYLLDYAPGISGTVQQAGSYSDVMTQEPGNLVGKKLWQFNVEGVVVGCTVLGPDIVLNTKKGHVRSLGHQKS